MPPSRSRQHEELFLSITNRDEKAWRRLAEKVFIERARLRRKDWKAHFVRLRRNAPFIGDALSQLGSDEFRSELDPRRFLIWAWCVLLSMPDNLREGFTKLKEGDAGGRGLEAEVERLRSQRLEFHGLETVPEQQLRWLAALTRLIDEDLASLDYWPADPSKWKSSEWKSKGYPCFIVPVQRAYRLKDGKEAEHRATQYHALVPTHVGELDVDLILHEDSTGSGEPETWAYGAAIFDDVVLSPRNVGEDEFILADAPGPKAVDAVKDQIAKALNDGCEVLAWPELTVPPDRLATIRQVLGQNPLSSAQRIPIVAAGSWHVKDGDTYLNRCEILQARGRTLTHCDKRRRFEFDGRKEAIVPTSRVPVIVMDDRLVAISICLDFCDDRVPDLYADLGVDLVIVPSMGEQVTTQGHQRHAKALQSRHGSVTFLVQQHPYLSAKSQKAGVRGYSFASPPDSKTGSSASIQNERYRKLMARR